MAKEIADALRDSVSIQITEIMEADAVNTIEGANLPTEPSSPSVMKNIAIGGLLGILIAAGIIILIFVLDDTIKTPDDVEYYLGLNTLTSIPIQEGVKKSKKVKGLSSRKLEKTNEEIRRDETMQEITLKNYSERLPEATKLTKHFGPI